MYDALIVGAGPAGNIAALDLSRRGYRVAVLDWRHEIGDKLCTGIIGAEGAARFPPDKEHVRVEARSATVVSPAGERYHVARPETQALIIDRVAYVAAIARRAMEAGAHYRLGTRVSNIEVSSGAVRVTTAEADQHLAKLVIIASGFGSPLLGMVGLGNGSAREHMVGAQVEVTVGELDGTEVYLGEHVAPGSFGWLVPLSDSRGYVGLLSRHKLNGHLAAFVSALRSSGKVRDVIEEPRRWGIPLKPLGKTYGDRVLVVGDTAGLVKPTTGGGIYYAFRSGEIAAEVAGEALDADDLSARRLRDYQSRWKALFGRELSVAYAGRMLYEGLGDRRIESLLDTLCSKGIQDELLGCKEFSFDWHSGVILKALQHRYLGAMIGTFGPIMSPFLSRLLGTKP